MKMLFIAPRYEGGIGGHARRVAEKLRQHGFDIKLMEAPNIPIKNLKNPSFVVLSTLKAIFSKERYDIVHAFNVPSAFAMKYVKAKKRVLSVHGVYSDQIGTIHSSTTTATVNLVESKILSWADKLTTNSKEVQKIYKEKLGLDFELLLGPIDTNKFQGIEAAPKNPDKDQVIYIGRDSYEKGIDILKSIEPRLNASVIYCTNVEWKKAMSLLKSSNVLVLPSRVESIPNVIKEAYYLKIPVVATNVGGMPEIVIHEKTGLLVPPNDPKKLAEEINYLLENKDVCHKLADEGYEYLMNNFSWDVLLPKYIEFYNNLVKE